MTNVLKTHVRQVYSYLNLPMNSTMSRMIVIARRRQGLWMRESFFFIDLGNNYVADFCLGLALAF